MERMPADDGPTGGMLILGIADNHDAGAALVAGDRLVAACGQERIDRIKNSGRFPWAAIDAVLDQAGLRPRDVDRVVLGTGFTPSWLLRRFPALHHRRKERGGQFSPLLDLYVLYQVLLRRTGLHSIEVEACRSLVERRLREHGFERAAVSSIDHHAAHAHAAWRSQPHLECLVLTADAMGDGLSCTAWAGRGAQLDLLWSQSGLAGINTFYSRITEKLGFRALRHEGKVTGLAALAEPPPELVEHLRTALRQRGRGFNRLRPMERHDPGDAFYSVLDRYSREQVAAAAQAVLEDAVTAFARGWARRSGIRRLAVSGGVFANVKLNQRIASLPEVESLWVYPNMGDGGLPAGAAMGSAGLLPAPVEAPLPATVLLGPSYEPAELRRELDIAGLSARRPRDIESSVAALLAAGKVVARFDGPMEWGPRALGNRSILYRPDDPTVNDWLNRRLRRTEFMPFAPAVTAEDAPRLLQGLEKAPESARFMTVCFDCTEEMARLAPGVVHVDGTARPQVVHREDNPGFHRIIELFRERTGLPALINTSFNIHEEPIVCSPHDAIKAWRQSGLDALAIGPYLVENPPS